MLNLAFDSAVPSGNLSPEWVFTYGHTYIHNKYKLILSYIETAKCGKPLKSPPGGNWIHKLWSITTTEFLEAAKEKKIEEGPICCYKNISRKSCCMKKAS